MLDVNLCTGYYFSDEEFAGFCNFFFPKANSETKKKKKEKEREMTNIKRQLCTASNNVGDLESKQSSGQASTNRAI